MVGESLLTEIFFWLIIIFFSLFPFYLWFLNDKRINYNHVFKSFIYIGITILLLSIFLIITTFTTYYLDITIIFFILLFISLIEIIIGFIIKVYRVKFKKINIEKTNKHLLFIIYILLSILLIVFIFQYEDYYGLIIVMLIIGLILGLRKWEKKE